MICLRRNSLVSVKAYKNVCQRNSRIVSKKTRRCHEAIERTLEKNERLRRQKEAGAMHQREGVFHAQLTGEQRGQPSPGRKGCAVGEWGFASIRMETPSYSGIYRSDDAHEPVSSGVLRRFAGESGHSWPVSCGPVATVHGEPFRSSSGLYPVRA